MSKVIYFAPGLKPILKHLNGQHDQSTHGSWASGQELETWDPHSPIPDSPRNAGGMTERVWDAWEHGPDGDVFVELFRKYACQQLGLPVPKTPYDPGGYMAYTLQRGWGAPNRNEVSKMLEAIANSKPQPTLYRGLAKPTFTDDSSSDNELFNKFMSMKPGDQFDMPLASTTRSLGVAAWYAADRVKDSTENVIIKIQEGAKGVARKAENSYYQQDYEVVTSGKFEVVSINKVKAPYWSRGSFEARKTEFTNGEVLYEPISLGNKIDFPRSEAKNIYDKVASGNFKTLETPTLKFTADRKGELYLSSWIKQPEREFTVVEVKMVEPHKVQKSTDFGNEFFNMFNTTPFIRDNEPVEKHLQGQHDQRTHGSWSGGAGVDITSKLDKVFYASALKRDRGNRNEETQTVIDEIKAARLSKGSSSGDIALQIIAERQGFDGKPKLVKTVDDLLEIQKTEGGRIVYRGIADYEAKEGEGVSYTGAQAASDFRSGEYFAGFGMFGNGIYTTDNLDGAVAYASMKDDRYGRKGNGSTVAMLIPKDAKQAPREVVKEAVKTAQEETAPMWGLRATHRNDIGRILAAKGYQYYDAGDVQNNKFGNFVILDRSMLTVAEEDVK